MDEFINNQTENEADEFSVNEQEEAKAEVINNPSEIITNPIEFTPVTPVNDYKPMSKGLKIFALILSLLILITGTTFTGYFIGLNTQTNSGKRNVKVNLEAQPKDSKEMTAAQVYEDVDESIVGITIYNAEGDGTIATGIVYTEDGYIVTNDHIYSEVANAKFKIYTSSGKEYDANFIAGDSISDLAVLKVDKVKFKPAKFGNSDELYMGQNVVAIGRPLDSTAASSITSGIISATNRRVSNSSSYPARLIQTDCPINPGSSGGALINMYGQVVGVTSSKVTSVAHEGMGYAIPTTVMKRIVTELINEGKVVSRAKLGITYQAIDSVTAELNGITTTGLQIQSVATDSDLFGKVSKGDVITEINNKAILDDDMVLDIIEECSAGDTITVTVITTTGDTKTLTVTLMANISESSYKSSSSSQNNTPDDKTFNFPSGE